MAKERLSMRKIKEVLRLHFDHQQSARQIAKSCGIARSTVKEYLDRVQKAGFPWPLPAEWDDAVLENRLFPPVSLISPEIIYDDGWHQPETNMQIKNPEERNWRWTSKRSVCIIENPKKESTLIIRGAMDKNKIKDQKVIIKINDQILEEFIPEQNVFIKKYTIAAEKLGAGDDFNLIIETDKTFIPSKLNPENKDNRELGIQIFFLYFREAFK